MRVALLSVVTAACSGHSGDKPAGTGADPWGGSADVPAPQPAAALEIYDAGKEPRRVLAYGLAPVERTLRIRTEATAMADVNRPVVAELVISWSCASGGKCHYATRSFMVGSDAEFQEVARSVAGDATVAADGTALIQPTTMVHLTPDPVEILRYAIARFPATPVGAGAHWHVGRHTWSIESLSPLVLQTTDGDATGETSVVGTLHVDPAEPLARELDLTTDLYPLDTGRRLRFRTAVTLR